MRTLVRISVLPLLGATILVMGVRLNWRELQLRILGHDTTGEIAGMVLQRADHADIVIGLETKLRLHLANGDEVRANYRDYRLTSLHRVSGGKMRAVELSRDLPGELERFLADAVKGDAAMVRWALLRESGRLSDPLRVERLEKDEIIHGYFNVPTAPSVLHLDTSGAPTLNEDGNTVYSVSRSSVSAVFEFLDSEAVRRSKGETLVSYRYERGGEEQTPPRKNFFLGAEPYTTEFRPIFSYSVNGQKFARLSHIGRQGGPTLALKLFGPCRVYYSAADPTEAIVIADAGQIEGNSLAWFTRFCEGALGQWGSGALIFLAGSTLIIVGTVGASLHFIAPRAFHRHGAKKRILKRSDA